MGNMGMAGIRLIADQHPRRQRMARQGALASLAPVAATLVGLPLRGIIDAGDMTMLYQAGVLLVALRLGFWPALLASLESVLAFNLVFVEPYFTLSVLDPSAYLTFFIMLASSLLVSAMASNVATRLSVADQERAEGRLLLELSRDLATASSRRDVDSALRMRFGAFLINPSAGDGNALDSAPMPSVIGQSSALQSGGKDFGTLALPQSETTSRRRAVELETIAALVAGTLLRIDTADQTAKLEAESKGERLRNVLLSSLSHDLRTPLTVLSGTVSNLVRMRRKLPREAMEEVTDLLGQVTHLQKFTGNLLKISAISSGNLRLNRQAYGIAEIVGVAIQRAQEVKGNRQIKTHSGLALPMVDIDGALIEQVVSNLLDNAIAHTDDNGTITIRMERAGPMLRVSVLDDGPGLRPGDDEIIFERFRTGNDAASDRRAVGSHGLGLAICRGIVEAHGGVIDGRNNIGAGGACFSFTLPALADASEAEE